MLLKISLGDDYSKNVLIEKYKNFSWALAKKMVVQYEIADFTLEDYMALAFSALTTALKTYNFSSCTFYGYWYKIAINEIKTAIRRYLSMNRHLTNNTLSLDKETAFEQSLHDVVSVNELYSEQNLLRDNFIAIIDNPNNDFTDSQRTVIKLYLDGYEFKEIAGILNWSRSKVYSLYYKAIEKIRKCMREPK